MYKHVLLNTIVPLPTLLRLDYIALLRPFFPLGGVLS